MTLSVEAKSRAYKLAHALEVAAMIKEKAQDDTITVSDALRQALKIHPLDWWLWELRMHRMFEDCTYHGAYRKLQRLADGHHAESFGSDDMSPEHIASCLTDWAGCVNDSEHTYAGEVGFVNWIEEEMKICIYTYDPNPDDPLDGVVRIIERLS